MNKYYTYKVKKKVNNYGSLQRYASPYACWCGKYQGLRYLGVVCGKCFVEVEHYKKQLYQLVPEHLKKNNRIKFWREVLESLRNV